MEIRSFGVGERMRECERILSSCASGRAGGSLVLLPIPTSRDNIYITGTSVEISDILPLIESGGAMVGYNIPRLLTDEAKRVGAIVYDAALDEEFLVANAELTARGTVGYILTHYSRDLSDMSVGVVGYGRIGMRLVRWLLLFGADVTVYTRRQSLALELCENGISAVVVGENADISGLDLLINTAPEKQIDDRALSLQTDIIDLASGNIFEPSARLVKLASIPDSYYPKSAGRLYAEGAIKALGGGER